MMKLSHRARKYKQNVRLTCDQLEDRSTPAVAYALSGTNLFSFDTANPTAVSTTAITGVAAGETLVGIDFRPQNGQLYSLGVNSVNDTATLYSISTRTGTATAVGTPGSVAFTTTAGMTVDLPDPTTVGYGFDFNPSADRVRVVAGSLNFRVNPNNGAAVDTDGNAVNGINPDGNINTGTTIVDAAAYTNNMPNNGGITTLYTLDAATNSLYIQAPPNAGTQSLVMPITLNGVPLDFTSVNGFDIPAGVNAAANDQPAPGSAFAVLNVNGMNGLYSINLASGAAMLVGSVAPGMSVQGFAIQNNYGGTPAIGLSADGTSLVRFNTATPTMTTPQAITGVAGTDRLVGIDFRPATGQLYALGVNFAANTATLYLIDPQTGQATVVGTPGGIAFVTTGGTPVIFPDPTVAGYGFDFNPTVDRIRVVTSTGLNFRINPNNGAPVDNDANAGNGINPDGNLNGGATSGSATAYTNSFGQPLTGGVTTQYTLDATTNSLYIQSPPNNGTLINALQVTLNGMPLDFTDVNGFDIPGGVRVTTSGTLAAGFGYAVLTVSGTASLYQINLVTGAAVNLGQVGPTGGPLAGFTLADAPAGTVAFSNPTYMVGEGNGNAIITLTRTGGSTGLLTVTVNITGGTGTPGVDFPAGPYTVVFADGQTTATLIIPITNDMMVESPETIQLALMSPSNGAVLGMMTTATLTINDNDVGAPTPVNQPGYVVGTAGNVQIYNADGSLRSTITPFAGTTIPLRTATGDFNGDGFVDVVVGTGTTTSHVKVYDGQTGALVQSFLAFPGFTGGVTVAAGDINGDGFDDIIVGAGPGAVGGHVKVFDGRTGAILRSFLTFDGFSSGVNVASGDVNNDGIDDIIVGASVFAPHVKVFNGATGALLQSFLAFPGFGAGVTVASGDVTGDGIDDLIVGASTTVSHVKVFDGTTGALVRSFITFPGFPAGVAVASRDINGDGISDILASTTSVASAVKSFSGVDVSLLGSFTVPSTVGGVFVG